MDRHETELMLKGYGLTTAEYERLLQAAPYVANLCQKLAACGIPMSLHHNDLHDANIFFAHSRPLFFDWGDSSIAHPFFSLRTVFVSIEYSFDLAEDDPLEPTVVAVDQATAA